MYVNWSFCIVIIKILIHIARFRRHIFLCGHRLWKWRYVDESFGGFLIQKDMGLCRKFYLFRLCREFWFFVYNIIARYNQVTKNDDDIKPSYLTALRDEIFNSILPRPVSAAGSPRIGYLQTAIFSSSLYDIPFSEYCLNYRMWVCSRPETNVVAATIRTSALA